MAFNNFPILSTKGSTSPWTATGATTARSSADRASEIKNVKDFGAIGDGVTDDTAAIQAAFNWNSLVANATTAIGNQTLHFSSVPADFFNSMGNVIFVYNQTNPTAIVSAIVSGFTSTTITLDVGVAQQVQIGDRIFFGRAKGTIFFPPGFYKITSTINMTTGGDNQSFIVQGCGGASVIQGTVSGYLLDCNLSGVNYVNRKVCDLVVHNLHTTAGGAIRLGGTIASEINNCDISGFIGITTLGTGGASQSNRISNCSFTTASSSVNSCGVEGCGDKTLIFACDFNAGFGRAIAASGTQINIINCRFEVNVTGIALGVLADGTAQTLLGFNIIGCGWESNTTGIDFEAGAGQGIIAGGQLQGFNGAGPGGTNPQYGIRFRGTNASLVVVEGFNVGGQFDIAAYLIANTAGNRAFLTFVSCAGSNSGTGVVWSLPTQAYIAEWINCNVQPTFLFAGLPPSGANRRVGDKFFITDANQATLGGVVTAGGAPNTSGYVVWNGTAWTLMSK